MICSWTDCNRIRKTENRQAQCPKKGRRLLAAWEFVEGRIAEFKGRLRDLTPATCEGSQVMYELLTGMFTKCISLLRLRWSYLNTVPWLYARADVRTSAQDIIDQMTAHALDHHDPFSRDLWKTHKDSLEAVAAGCPCPAALHEEVARLACVSLDESAGEGYHRSTNHEHVRAASSTDASLKRKTRERQMLAHLKRFVYKHKGRGGDVVRFEWKNWKRIVQTRPQHRWRSVRARARAVVSRVYREDNKADEDWSSVVTRLPAEHKAAKEKPEEGYDEEALRREWLLATIEPNVAYAVKHPVHQPTPEGGVEEVQRTDYFEVVNVAHARSRPTVMPTVLLPDAVMMREPVALEVRFLDAWQHEGIAPLALGSHLVYPEGDFEWLAPSRIAPFQFLQYNLTRFAKRLPSPEHPGCLVLSEGHVAGPRYPLEDERCPVLTIGWYLTQHVGWTSVAQRVIHESDAIATFDCRGGCSKRWYYRLLMQRLGASLPLSSGRIPSAQPQLYYRCLLDGIAAEPDMGQQHYWSLCNVGRKRKALPPIALPDPEDRPLPPIEGGGPVFADFDPPAPPAPPRGRGGRGGRGGRARGRGRGVEPLPLPPPLPPPPEDPPAPLPPLPPVGDAPLLASDSDAEPEPAAKRRRKKDELAPWYDGLEGARVQYDEPVVKGVVYRNYTITCLACRGHDECYKTKGALPSTTKADGVLEPLAFLHAWRHCPWPTPRASPTHRRENPTAADVGRYVEEHRAELQAVYDKIHT